MTPDQYVELRDRIALLKAKATSLLISKAGDKPCKAKKSVTSNDGKPKEQTGWSPNDGKPEFMAYAKDGEGAPAGGPDAGDVHVPNANWKGKKKAKKEQA